MKNLYFGLIIILFIFGCSTRNSVQVLKSNIGDNATISNNEVIRFVFDRDLKNPNSTDEYDTTQYIKFDPPIKGQFRWHRGNELTFYPDDKSILLVTEYSATLLESIVNSVKDLNLPKNNIFTFNSGKLEFENVNHFWTENPINSAKELNVSFKLSVPFKYSADENIISIYLNNEQYSPQNIVFLNSQELEFNLNLNKFTNKKENILKIVIDKGLVVGDAITTNTQKSITWEKNISSSDDFEVVWTETSTNTERGDLTYYFNYLLNQDIDYSSFINIEPKVNYEIEIFKNRMLLIGDFEPGETYKITLNKDFPNVLGNTLKENDVQFVQFNQLEKMIEFVEEDAIYLPSKGSRYVAVRLNGVKTLNLNVYKIYENNIIQIFNAGRAYDFYYDDNEDMDYSWSYYNTNKYGDLVYNSNIDLSSIEKKGNISLLKLDFKDYIRDRGVYVVRLIDSTNLSLQTDKIITISDIGIIAKTNNDDLFVSVNSLDNAEPIQGAKVRLISENNQIVEDLVTNNSGVVYFRELNKRKETKIPKLIKVEKNNDINYLLLSENTIFSNYIFDNLDGAESSGYKAFLYGDRELYRPGDSLVMAGIIRDENRKTLKNLPVEIQLLMPNSKIFKKFMLETDENGGFSTIFKIPENIITGSYRIKALTSQNLAIGERKINIEQFVPQRIKLTLKTDKNEYKSNEIIKVSALAENLFGTPAVNREYNAEISLRQKQFKNRDLQNYSFEIKNTQIDEKYQEFSGQTDNSGNISFQIPLAEFENSGLIEANISLTVFDESSRPVYINKIVPIETQSHFFGIGKINNWLNINQYYDIPLVAVKSNGESAGKVKASVSVVRKYWQTVARRSEYSDYIYYENQEREELVLSKDIVIDGKNGKIGFKPTNSGIYEIRVSYPNSLSYSSYEMMAYGYGFSSTNAFQVSKEGYIDIYSEKENYYIGDKAKLMFRTPFNGRLIVTIERGGIIENYNLTTREKTAELNLDIKDSYLPNIYVSAVLIKPLVDISIPINVAYGYLPIKVDKKSTILPISISANENSRSGVKQTVTVKTLAHKDVNVTIAVVDEGIHQIKKSETPNPHKFFYEKMALGVSTYDVYRIIFPELKSKKLSFGGGEGFDEVFDNFVMNKFADERVIPLAKWSGILKTDSKGEAKFEFELPKFSGSVRISAVAYIDDAFGSDSKNMTISDPIILSSAMPRFLTTGDESFSSVNISNTTNNTMQVSLNIKSSGPLKIENFKDNSISIPANSEKRVNFNVKALNYEGLGKIELFANSKSESQSESINLPIRYPAVFTKYYKSGSISGNNKKEFNFSNKFESGSSVTYLTMSKTPVVEYINGLEFLLNYPHGCMEQTVSQAFPLLYYPDLAKVSRITNDKYKDKDGERIIISVIDRTKMLQLPDGSWGMWESEYSGHWWTSCYTTHFLISAKNQGYNVSDNSIEKALNYLKLKSANAELTIYNMLVGNKLSKIQQYPREAIYGLFVLSLAGRADYSTMNFYKNKLNDLTNDSKILLASAYKLAGDNGNYKRIIGSVKTENTSYVIFPNTAMSSPIRDFAISLYSIIVSEPNDNRIISMTKQLGEMLKNKKDMTTQEAAFGFLALGKSLNLAANNKPVNIFANDDKNEIAQFDDKKMSINAISHSAKILLNSKAEGKAYYFINSYGIPKDGKYEEKDNYLKVRRTFYDKRGQEIKKLNFKSGDEIIVQLSISSENYGMNVNDMLISDLLPAGLEVENPRLKDTKSYTWIKYSQEPKHFDYRDDRVNIYFDFTENTSFYYVVRAVVPGKFKLGPVTANAMYNSDIFSISGSGIVNVKGK